MYRSAHTRWANSLAKLCLLSFLTILSQSDAVTALSTTQLVLGGPVEARSPYTVKEEHVVPRKWTKIGVPQPDHMINLNIAMKNTRFHELERHLYEVSDPSHSRYGKHLTLEEVDDLVQPTEHASNLVDEWLQDHGILPEQRSYSSSKQWITISLPVAKVEQMLQTKYAVYRHEGGDEMVRATSWSLPQHLHDLVATIQPTTAFMRAAPEMRTSMMLSEFFPVSALPQVHADDVNDVHSACNFSLVTPLCLRTLYRTINYKVRAPTKNQIGFTNYLGQVTNRSDASIFLQKYRPEAASSASTYKEISIAGGPVDNGTTGGGSEALLDLETILAQVYPMSVVSYSTGGSPPFNPDLNSPTNTNEPYLVWLNYIRAQKYIPQTISTSYGDDEQTVPKSYADTICQGFAELGARGITLLISSGDSGVGANGTCLSNDGKNTTMFIPEFPSSCPYVTSVGGTRDYPEIVAYDSRNGYFSGSGFSNYYPRPKYQDRVVSKYISSLKGEFDGLYNKTGRAYPDLAAQGFSYAVIFGNRLVKFDGTSCSAPTTSSVISLVNDALVAAGRSTLGWLNPLLYSGLGAHAFNDVVSGSSAGCDTAGFSAAKGWDAASGFGTPDFVKILKGLGLKA